MTAAKAGTGAGSAGGILASFLDCIADPVQVDTLFEVINSWFDEEQEAFAIASLETYSETVWELLAAHCEAKERGGGARLDCIELTPQMIAAGQFRDGRGEERMIDAADLVRLRAATGAFRAGPGRLAFRHRHDPEGPAGFAILVADDTGITAWLAREGFDDLTVSFFQDAFGLSSSEIEVLVALLSGSRLRDIAQSRDRSLETVRNQIKAIAAKIGVAGQSDIIRVAQDIRAIETATRGASAEIADATGARRLRLPDGRDLVYDVFGDGRRETLVFFHCLTSGRHWSKGAREAFSAEGYRVIAISRAGYGGSSPHARTGPDRLAQHARDTGAVLSHEGVTRCSVISVTTGVAPAYAFCQTFPHRVRRLVAVNPIGPVLSVRDTRGLSGGMKAGALTALLAPSTFRLLCRFTMRKLAAVDYSPSTPILLPHSRYATLENPDGILASRENAVDIATDGGESISREASWAVTDWVQMPAGTNYRPPAIFICTEDSPFCSADSIRGFARRLAAPCIGVPSLYPMLNGECAPVFEALQVERPDLP